VWTNSRAGWISFAVALIFLGILIFCKIKKKRVLINIFFTLVIILVLMFPLYPRLYDKLYGRFAAQDKGSAKSRIPQFEVAFNIIQEYPFLGIGINNYSEIMYEYDTTDEGLYQITPFPVHNIFLHITAEMGIFALFIFIWIIITIYLTGLIYIFKYDNLMIHVVAGMLSGILAFLIHGLVDTASIGSKMFVFLWFFAGIIVGIKEIKNEKKLLIK
jgi:O-antigen ligase